MVKWHELNSAIIKNFILYGCETQYLTLREEDLRVFGNNILRTRGQKREEQQEKEKVT
jgi:hypothetical protein